ncbi:MAG: Asp-tRNA(Asn)/Glu-tRNA(Gln) amidotransferase subunit GatB [Clostridia bacterium]|nr:Asp-tRNA(Asn)/Glu-tRNA(Gln) amidotransferase subunit GatB [Clostridia bacterium]
MKKTDYEVIVGLEVHAELKTASKIFCSCSTAFGASPNTQCCPVCVGLPGGLPVLNRRAVELAVRAGLALGCHISGHSRFDRKQYFYPDLPKAYQVTQNDRPLCRDGALTVQTSRGERTVGITRIHLEEDAGKLIHQGDKTFVDCNRCGIPLIEIVSAPDIRSGEEAVAYLRTLRNILVTCGVSDCKMEEGSMRCDVNLSVRRVGSSDFGVRTEIKNINSFSFTEKAIAYEAERQMKLLEAGEPILLETRRYDPDLDQTLPMRKKEVSEDYRYLREPNLPMLCLTEQEIATIRSSLPELPDARAARLCRQYGLTAYDASVLTSDFALADYFEEAATHTAFPKLLVNLLLTELLRHCKGDPFGCPVAAHRLGALAGLLGEGRINSSIAKKLLIRLTKEDFDPDRVAEQEQLTLIRDERLLRETVQAVIAENPQAVADYRGGRTAALRALQGALMARTGGRADPVLAQRLLTELLDHTKAEA